ncbi:hypothetical protein CDAR_474321 [Caerostris darwini]|uniref:Secreted protein n=1 Tax=Caerostris darwini TaxID=1538125 RepID=A0AAV4M5F2_9ARAC|nr:hypothetical protein CDAR_474321 [Caerostris darwini]
MVKPCLERMFAFAGALSLLWSNASSRVCVPEKLDDADSSLSPHFSSLSSSFHMQPRNHQHLGQHCLHSVLSCRKLDGRLVPLKACCRRL